MVVVVCLLGWRAAMHHLGGGGADRDADMAPIPHPGVKGGVEGVC